MTASADLAMVNLDSSDPAGHAAFYHRLLGWEITHSQPEYAMISGGGTSIGFGLVEGYQPPSWPDPSGTKRYHLDLYVDDLATATQEFVAAGASKPDFQPGGDKWVVLIDPIGQPFCLSPRPKS
ncbi:VOC family protein [Micromonospora vulcania]|uniref:VOC family protein n=1 Tax=Micromonospora vulcania TaxID=1441873 RepID=A0ABW1HC00_9ACTN